MTHDNVIRLAREAGLVFNEESGTEKAQIIHKERVERFASMVAAAEREACADQMMQEHENYRRAADSSDDHDHIDWCQTAALVYGRAADSIRARTN